MHSQSKYRDIIDILDSDEEVQEILKKQTEASKYILSTGVKMRAGGKVTRQKEPSSQSHPISRRSSTQARYEDVCLFNSLQMTNNLKNNYFKLINFLEDANKNVLFVFGPSGSGKTILTTSLLQSNSLQYQFLKEKEQQNEFGEPIYEDCIDMVYRMFSKQDKIREKIYLSKDFPAPYDEMHTIYMQKYKLFKEGVHGLISRINNLNKYIFLLNSQIYSSFYLLSEASETQAFAQLRNVAVIKMEAYGLRQMKQIINKFIDSHPIYTNITANPKILAEILTEANGDARKALHLIYTKKIRQLSRLLPSKNIFKGKIKFYDQISLEKMSLNVQEKQFFNMELQEDKEESKVSIFHALGKLLYAKRYNIYYKPNEKANKKTNSISCYYSEEELERLNPKFYFKPVQLLEKCHLNINICADLLEQNFLSRYGKIKDIAKMYSVFRYFDSYLSDSLGKFEVKEQMDGHLKELLTWGIIICNKNPIRQTSFLAFQRSKNNALRKIVGKKEELIDTYYRRFQDALTTVKYRRQDIIQYSNYLRPNRQNINDFFLKKLLEIVFDCARTTGKSGDIERETNVIHGEQEEIAIESCNNLNTLHELLGREVGKKRKMLEMMIEDSEGQDIDSD